MVKKISLTNKGKCCLINGLIRLIFFNGFAKAKLDDKWNYINEHGQYLSKLWFDILFSFYKGIASDILNNKAYSLNKECQLLDYKAKQPINTNESKHRKKTVRLTESEMMGLIHKVLSQLIVG